jgi:hypothetical protein
MKTLGRAACSAVLALELVAYATSALASSCSVALARFNGLIKVNDDWYYDAFKKAMGAAPKDIPLHKADPTEFCPKLLPIWRERLRRQQDVVVVSADADRACGERQIDVETERKDAWGSTSPQKLSDALKTAIQACEQAIKPKGQNRGTAKFKLSYQGRNRPVPDFPPASPGLASGGGGSNGSERETGGLRVTMPPGEDGAAF